MVLGSTTTTAEHGGGPPGVQTHHGQHLFMNGPTIAHPPTATADRGRGVPRVTESKRRDKEERGGQNRRRERRGQQSCNCKYVLWFVFSFSSSRWYQRLKTEHQIQPKTLSCI